MKLINYAAIAAAAILTMASCNKMGQETETTRGAVQLQFSGLVTRGLDNPTGGDNGDNQDVVVNSVTVTFEAAAGSDTKTFTSLADASAHVFENVLIPSKLKVSINNGTVATGEANISDFVDAGLAIPAYGETTEFTPTEEVSSVEKQKIYKATVNLVHNYARLEFSGITKQEVDNSIFSTIQIKGVFLDRIKMASDGTMFNFELPSDFNAVNANIKDEINANFLQAGVSFPTEAGKCFAYNVYGNDIPLFTIAFDNCTLKSGATIEPVRYAQIKKYKKAGTADEYITAFEPGKIYRITKLEVADQSIAVDPGTDEYVAVQATVTIAPWSIVNTEVEW